METLLSAKMMSNVTIVFREVDKVREEKSGLDHGVYMTKKKHDGLRKEKLMKRQARLVKLFHDALSYFGNGTLYRLARQRANDRNRCVEQREELRKDRVSPIIAITLFNRSYCFTI